MTSALATRLCGSDDLYDGRGPLHSINFISCHDGFTLNDLVSYNHKHNEANGEGNRDGSDANLSWNCGVEGPTDDPEVLALRRQQARNLMATLMISQGVPMILGGDEFLRTQQGNNNAWCQDNALSWVDWTLPQRNADFLRFTRMMIALRQAHPALRRRTFFSGERTASRRTSSGTASSRRGPTSARRATRSPSRSTAGGPTGPAWSTATSTWPLTPRASRSSSASPPHPRAAPGAGPSTRPCPSPDDIIEEDQGPPVPVPEAYPVRAHAMIILVSEADSP